MISLEKLTQMGVTIEEFDDYAHRVELARRRAKYAAQPEKAIRQRERNYQKFLAKQGFLVLDGRNLPAPPWTNETVTDVLACLEEMQEQAIAARISAGGAVNE